VWLCSYFLIEIAVAFLGISVVTFFSFESDEFTNSEKPGNNSNNFINIKIFNGELPCLKL